jgi:hypothetical protein
VHYYKFNLKDYAVSTPHLSNEEDLCYRRLMDLYYLNEAPLADDKQMLSKRCRLPEQTISAVLQEFFKLEEIGWIHGRCDEEIAATNRISEMKKEAGKRGGKATAKQKQSKSKADAKQVQSTGSALASTHNPLPNISPIVPGGDGQADLIEENLSLHRAKMLFRMRPSTQLDSSQIRSWKKNKVAVESTSEGDWLLLEWYFAQGGEVAEYRRRDLSTLLNNWNGEIQRAAEIAKKKGANFAKKERAADSVPARWREILVDRYPQNFPDGITGGNFPNNFSLLPASVQAEIRDHDGLVSQISEAIHATPSEEAA